MKKTVHTLFLLLVIGPANASNWNNPNPFVDMMRSMLDIFEMMQLYQDFSGQIGRSSRPSGMRPPMSAYSRGPSRGATVDPRQEALLEGAWASQNRILLAIKEQYARMYWSQEQYQDYYLEILPEHLRFTDAKTGQVQEFEYRIKDDQLALRDTRGRVVQFFRINQERAQPAPESSGNFWDPNTQ
ncbi:hypothetical protein [Thiolapillus sp.]